MDKAPEEQLNNYLLSEIETIDLAQPLRLVDETVAKLTANARNDLETELSSSIPSQELSSLTQRDPYPGPNTPNFADLHPTAQDLFRQADEAYWTATGGRHLTIESGTRTVYRQAELFMCWRLGEPGCNPANIPGASIHNYGLAIDIQRAAEQQVVTALDNNGWDRTVMPREPWHWECVGTTAHTEAIALQNQMRRPGSIARRWQSEWETARRKNDQRNEKIEDFNQRVTIWQPEWDRLGRDIDDFNDTLARHNREADQFQVDVEEFNRRVNRHNQEVQDLQALLARIEAMEPSEERNRLIREYNRRASAAQAEASEINRQRAGLEQREAQLERQAEDLRLRRADIEQRHATLDLERIALLRLQDEIAALLNEINQHLADARVLLDQIAEQVHP